MAGGDAALAQDADRPLSSSPSASAIGGKGRRSPGPSSSSGGGGAGEGQGGEQEAKKKRGGGRKRKAAVEKDPDETESDVEHATPGKGRQEEEAAEQRSGRSSPVGGGGKGGGRRKNVVAEVKERPTGELAGEPTLLERCVREAMLDAGVLSRQVGGVLAHRHRDDLITTITRAGWRGMSCGLDVQEIKGLARVNRGLSTVIRGATTSAKGSVVLLEVGAMYPRLKSLTILLDIKVRPLLGEGVGGALLGLGLMCDMAGWWCAGGGRQWVAHPVPPRRVLSPAHTRGPAGQPGPQPPAHRAGRQR